MTAHVVGSDPGGASLYVVATPIGNLGDITLRAIETLKRVGLVAAEDTRTTGRMLAHFGIDAKLTAVHEHNERSATRRVLEVLGTGASVALVSDAGTPALSDPGAWLVSQVRAAGFRTIPIPGPNAAIAAWSVSGFGATQFRFVGFLPPKAGARRSAIADLAQETCALVFYEAPHRVAGTLADLSAGLGAGRRIVIARELTKMFESVHECALGEAAGWLAEDTDRSRGEFVLLVGPSTEPASSDDGGAERLLGLLLRELPLKQAVALAAEFTGGRRNELYERALALRQQGGGSRDDDD